MISINPIRIAVCIILSVISVLLRCKLVMAANGSHCVCSNVRY